jgi:transcriptional regulator with GAF, ATPase, and Fis domain
MIGTSPSIQKVKNLTRQIAAHSNLNIIICGESGVGKELVASALHQLSNRKHKPFVKVNCAAIPTELLESELFGYEMGAFTGADRPKAGKFELAHEGTIFLDEIGDMSLFLQSKLLQVLQDFQFARLGAKKDVNVDCWVLAATNHNLEEDVAKGRFREDLYYRLNIIRIFVPPLRERPDDVNLLIDHFAGQIPPKGETPGFRFPDHVRDFLCQYSWPGNVRELKNTVERLMILGDWHTVKEELQARETRQSNHRESTTHPPDSRPKEINDKAGTKKKFPPLKEVKRKAIQKAESRLISEALEETNWNRKRAAELLQISYKALLYKVRDFGLDFKN